MAGAVLWCVVVLGMAIGVALTVTAFAGALPETCASRSRVVRLVALSVAGLLVLALLWRVEAIASADGSVVARMAQERGSTLTAIMSVVTTMGDVVPSFVISAVLALLIYLQGRHRLLAWVPPLLVLGSLAVQFSLGALFHDVTIAQVQASVPLGGTGTIPSGSVTRLLSVFLVTAVLWGAHNERGAQRLAALGGSLAVVQAMSRLYLGRHLLGDMVGGMLLGLILAICAAWLLRVMGVGLASTQVSPSENYRETRAT